MVDSVTMPMAVIAATFTEFHSHSSTGKGGGVTLPSAWVTLRPSASRQWSKET
ncbi:Uncharacterised protein [Serratia rubidaea]|uniref:Uncharacterized protein n=1 Tax=Serratia rubidaea TaxID=61652 RepID=A0A4U9HU12_SERRU|nr:Uncharacterised protein [Serratia rubidaea]